MRNRRTYTPLGAEKVKAPLKHTPFPGVIDGNRWRIREGRWPAFINRSDLGGEGGIMQVPLDNSEAGRKLRLHEEAHVAWTPEPTPAQRANFAVQARTLDSCEDARIITMMNRRSKEWARLNRKTDMLPPELVIRHKADFVRLVEKLTGQGGGETEDPVASTSPPTISLLEAARLLASSRGYYEAQHFNQAAAEAGLEWVVVTVQQMHDRFIGLKREPTFSDAVDYARELERYFGDAEEQVIEQNETLKKADLPPDFMPRQSEENLIWGRMRIEHAPLTERLRHDPSRKVRATDDGAVPRYMHRLTSDQRIFGRRRKRPVFQGTVLIDHSGSMQLEPFQVDEMLGRWPAVTIATYCGDSSHGVLRIVAHKGKRASEAWLDRPSAGSNVIDGPALDWLCKQRGPRVWISDGGVSGWGENFHPWFRVDAARKVARGKIKRIADVQSLLGT